MVRRRLSFVIAILIGTLCARSATADILIGVATALTGPVAWEGASSQVGADAAVAQLNAQGGVLGERIEMIVVDDACAADQAVLAARKLIDAGVVAVIGHQCSAASIPASQLYAKAGMLMISPFFSNPKLTEQCMRTVFRAYAIVQAWAQAVERAGTFAPDAIAEVLHARQFDTVLGRIGFDEKGDVTGYGTYVWHVWQDGAFIPLEEGGPVSAADQ